VIGFGLDDAWYLGVLSSRFHVTWTLANGGTLEDRPRYNKDMCFDTFPFPATEEIRRQPIRALANELDTQRKNVLSDHPDLTLTDIYNVLERVRGGVTPDTLDPDDRRIYDDGLVLVLKELHDKLDVAVAAAYGWEADLSEDELSNVAGSDLNVICFHSGNIRVHQHGDHRSIGSQLAHQL
jgi:hypothetical protein